MAKGYWGQQLQNALGAFLGTPGAPSGAYLRDFRHAAKTFLPDSYALAPKFKFLFHTYFKINPAALDSTMTGNFSNYGLLVKDIRLPSYRFSTHTLNQYNRKRIVQTKINYDPVEITFHDDNSNVINKLWYAYYTYYYKDAAKLLKNPTSNTTQSTQADFNNRNIYKDDAQGSTDWGYIGEVSTNASGASTKKPFFDSITVYGFNQHQFIAYQLINPIIVNFNHDSYDYDQGNGIMQNRMTVDYETVQYYEGAFNGETLPDIETGNFADATHYDREPSPITIPGANGKILGQGGFVDGIGGFINALNQKPPNLLGAIKVAGATYNNAKSFDFKTAARQEAENLLTNAIGQLRIGPTIRNQTTQTPIKQETPTNNGAGSPTISNGSQPGAVGGPPTAGTQVPRTTTPPQPRVRGPI